MNETFSKTSESKDYNGAHKNNFWPPTPSWPTKPLKWPPYFPWVSVCQFVSTNYTFSETSWSGDYSGTHINYFGPSRGPLIHPNFSVFAWYHTWPLFGNISIRQKNAALSQSVIQETLNPSMCAYIITNTKNKQMSCFTCNFHQFGPTGPSWS